MVCTGCFNILRYIKWTSVVWLICFTLVIKVFVDQCKPEYIITYAANNSYNIHGDSNSDRNFLQHEEEAPSEDIFTTLSRIRSCTQAERISHMKTVCEQKYEVSRSVLMTPAGRNLIDHVHKMTFCWMSKSGCTALKAFILQANGMKIETNNQQDSLNTVHFLETYVKYGLQQMYQLHVDNQVQIAKDYVNIMAIRHPFERLVAYYRDKIVDFMDMASNHPQRAAEILRESRPDTFAGDQSLSIMSFPQQALGPPTFSEFLQWVKRHKVLDEHWGFISDACHPCAHDWEAILRVETMETDGLLLAKAVNFTEEIPIRHSHQTDSNYSQFGKRLDHFTEVNEDVINYILDFYKTDMKMFGYRWDKQSQMAYCAIDTDDGMCC